MPKEPVNIPCICVCFVLNQLSLGIGEHGKPANLTAADLPDYEKLYKVNGFNAALSDKIAVDRSVPDIRHKGWVFVAFLIYRVVMKKIISVHFLIVFFHE